jgi:PAS domain S-box-containing protein
MKPRLNRTPRGAPYFATLPNYLGRVVLLSVLYVVTGKLGLMLAVPPGYATLIWPASGIAIGMLMVHGARLWPGVLLGSYLLNAYNSGVFADADWTSQRSLVAFLIACGSTLQALAARGLIARFAGLPLRLRSGVDVFKLLAIAGPLSCMLAASIGVGTLVWSGIVPIPQAPGNWLAWWAGDSLGVVVFMPLVLLSPGNRSKLTWRNATIGRLPLAALLLLLLPLGLTFFAWKATTEIDYQRGQAKFEALTVESDKALQDRIGSYGNALLGAAGFLQASSNVSRQQWRTYVDTLHVRENFPGITGIGWVQPVQDGDLPQFLRAVRADGAPDFTIHPQLNSGPDYVITLMAPESDNRAAIGLNLAFESERLATAELARDTGKAAISGPVVLVQDEKGSPGFSLLFPIYQHGLPVGTREERRAALRGWTYAPFIARNFLGDLTHSQRSEYRLRIYDGTGESPGALIFASDAASATHPTFSKRGTLDVMQRKWLLVWESTPAFEQAEHSANSNFILLGGVLFTALLGLLLVVLTVRRTEHIERMVGERRFAVPMMVFAVLAAATFALYSKLAAKDLEVVQKQTQDEASKVESLLRTQINERVASLGRMAARWDAASGTPYRLWRLDAANHVAELAGLRALEWIDPGYHVRWVEPLAGNESALGLDVLFDSQRANALRGAAARNTATITPPIRLVQGYSAFIAYLPLKRSGQFDGFIAGAFSIDDFFHGVINAELSRNYTMAMIHDGTVYFSNAVADEFDRTSTIDKAMALRDQSWVLRMAPTAQFVASQKSELPLLVMLAGLMVSALSALSVRYILISKLKSAHLSKSLALNAGIISSSAHLVIAIDEHFRIMTFNRAAEQALGYEAVELVGKRAIPIFLLAEEMAERARTLSEELGEKIDVGPAIFTRIPLRDGHEQREWAFVRKNGSRFPASVTITPLHDEHGAATGFLGVIEDISTRREVERLKSEFTAVVSHELRTPLTSIRGSLGLILGALSASLPEKVKNLLEIAQSNCERLVLLINDILDIEKFSAGQMRFDIRDLALERVLKLAIEANEGYARRFNVRIELETVDPEWQVGVDPDRFIQVMSNLLSNASKYSPTGGVVKVSAVAEGSRVKISVHDDGPGIPVDFHGRIFEKFSQADSSTTRQKGGTGLGLHIARRFVEHMHGHIGFESGAGKGAHFWVELPLTSQSQDRGNHQIAGG